MNKLFSLLCGLSLLTLNCAAIKEGVSLNEHRAPVHFDHGNPHANFPISNTGGSKKEPIKIIQNIKENKNKK